MTRKLTAVLAAALALAGAAVFGSPAYADEVRDKQWHLEYLKVSEAQQISKGKGITVAVIDTGVSNHPDLSGSVLKGVDFVDKGGSGQSDDQGHGTAMAGLIAAHGKSGNGALGIAPDAKILPIRIYKAAAPLKTESDADEMSKTVALAIRYAVKQGAQVISMSISIPLVPELTDAVGAAAAADVVMVAASGNKPLDIRISPPAFFPQVMAVGAVDRSGNIADITVTGSTMDIVAPGEDLVVTNNDGRYMSKHTGTSDATAIVAGAAALVRSKYPDMKATEVVKQLESTAVDKGAPGVDDEYGHGVLDIVSALKGGTEAEPSSSATSAATPGVVTPTAEAAAPSGGGNTGLVIGGVVFVFLLGGVGLFFALRARSRPGS